MALAWMGHAETALERGQRAIRLSPFDPLNYMSYGALAIAYFHTGSQARIEAGLPEK